MRDQYRVTKSRGSEVDLPVHVEKTLSKAVAFARKDDEALRLRNEGYKLRVYRDQPSLVYEVPALN